MVRISIIIVNFNARYFLRNCIESVLESVGDQSLEIIVVDNASTDSSCDMLRNDFSEVKLLRNRKNIGFSRANNMGVAKASGEFVLILNPDTLIDSDTLNKACNFCVSGDKIGAIGVQFIDGRGKFLPECKRNFPSLWIAAAKILGYSKNYHANQIQKNEIAEVDILSGAFMFLRKSVYEQVHGFDEDFFMYGEDIDLSYRISKAGFQNYYLGQNCVLHFKGESTIRDRRYIENFYGAFAIFYKKHFQLNFMVDTMINVLVSGMIFWRSIWVKSAKKSANRSVLQKKKWMLLSKNREMYEKLTAKYPESYGTMVDDIVPIPVDTNLIFLDRSMLSFSAILKLVKKLETEEVCLRIISSDGSFYLGSDDSNQQGEVELI